MGSYHFSTFVPAVCSSLPAGKGRCRHKIYYTLLFIIAAATTAHPAALRQYIFFQLFWAAPFSMGCANGY